jgi:hypothetical protein
MGPLETEVDQILDEESRRGPMGQYVAEHGSEGGFGMAFVALSDEEQLDQILRTLTGLANALRRVAREIDQLHGPTNTGTNSN